MVLHIAGAIPSDKLPNRSVASLGRHGATRVSKLRQQTSRSETKTEVILVNIR